MTQLINYPVTKANRGDWVTIGKQKVYQLSAKDEGSFVQISLGESTSIPAPVPTPVPVPPPVQVPSSTGILPSGVLALFGEF